MPHPARRLALIAVMSIAATASAAHAAADSGGYTLFDPTPADQLRPLCTDRPTKANGACTVDPGHVQYETDLFNATHSVSGGVTQNTYLFTNPTLKLGLTANLDAEISIAPLEEVVTHDKATHADSNLTGTGDLYLRLKYNLLGNDGGPVAVALVPSLKIPTAPPSIGNKAYEGGVLAPITLALPRDFSLTLQPEADWLENTANDGYHGNYAMLASLSRALWGTVTGYVELWGDENLDPAGAVPQSSFDLSVSWLARDNLQFDAGVNFGLNEKTPDVQGYLGLSQRF